MLLLRRQGLSATLTQQIRHFGGSGVAKPVDLSTFRGRVKARRLEVGLSQEAMGQALGFSSNWGYGVEANRHAPSPEVLPRLAALLRCDVAWLLSGEQAAESEFIAAMRGVEMDLTPRQREQLDRMAIFMAEQNREVIEYLVDHQVLLSDTAGVERLQRLVQQEIADAAAADARRRRALTLAATLPTGGERVNVPVEPDELPTQAESP
jgi:transcriptional regulator with XRE-family HTH domain